MLRYADSRTLGQCPAAVYMDSGDIEINTSVWDTYTPFQQQFILRHEEGHYRLQTDDETLADRYALHRLHATQPRSLKQSLATLARLRIPASRLEALYRECLLLDAEGGNTKAFLELTKYLPVKTCRGASQQKTKNIMKPSKLREQKFYRADGSAIDQTSVETLDVQDQKVDAIINKMYEREVVRGGEYGFERRFNFKHHINTLLVVTVLLFCIAIYRKVS